MRPVHPGEVLLNDYLVPLRLSVRGLSSALKVSNSRMARVVNGRSAVDAKIALRLERYFGADAVGWLNLQQAYDLRVAEIDSKHAIAMAVQPRTT
jgi:addiction module HigA family antidote